VRIVTPVDPIPAAKSDRVLICLQGGGFTADSGSLTESIPISAPDANQVISVLYRLRPSRRSQPAVDDSVRFTRSFSVRIKPQHMANLWRIRGGNSDAEVAVKIKQLGLPMPGALASLPLSDFQQVGRLEFDLLRHRLAHTRLPKKGSGAWLFTYVGSTDPKDPCSLRLMRICMACRRAFS